MRPLNVSHRSLKDGETFSAIIETNPRLHVQNKTERLNKIRTEIKHTFAFTDYYYYNDWWYHRIFSWLHPYDLEIACSVCDLMREIER